MRRTSNHLAPSTYAHMSVDVRDTFMVFDDDDYDEISALLEPPMASTAPPPQPPPTPKMKLKTLLEMQDDIAKLAVLIQGGSRSVGGGSSL
jgi:hypothetical protein